MKEKCKVVLYAISTGGFGAVILAAILDDISNWADKTILIISLLFFIAYTVSSSFFLIKKK